MIGLRHDLLRGSYPPLVTPFRQGEVDLDAYAALVELQMANGAAGIVVNGTTAEPSTLTTQERERLLEIAVEAADGIVPVVAATGSQSYAESLRLTRHAAEAGADAVLVVTPYYIRPSQDGLVEYFTSLGAATELPFLIYHIPGRAAVGVDQDTLARIGEATPTLVGMKHAVNDLGLVSDCLVHFGPDFRIMVGLEELSFPMLALGAAGMVNAVSNVAPAKVAELAAEMAAGSLAGGRRLHFELLQLNRAVFWDTNPVPIKHMMKRLGILPTNEHRLPLIPASRALEARLDQLLDESSFLRDGLVSRTG